MLEYVKNGIFRRVRPLNPMHFLKTKQIKLYTNHSSRCC